MDKPPGPTPVTVTVYVPNGVVEEVGMLSVAVADWPDASVMVDGETDGMKPGDETVAEREMLPERPFWLERVIATDPEEPRRIGKDCGTAEMLKSLAGPTVREIVVERESGPTEPVTVTE